MAATVVVQTQTAGNQTQETSYLRVAHASPDAPAVDVAVDNETVLTNVSFGAVSEYMALDSGNHTVTITANGTDTVVFEDTVTLDRRTVTTLAASGEVSEDADMAFEPVTYNDNAWTPAENESAVSVIHLSPDAPAVDVTANDGAVVLADNLSYQDASDYVSVPEGTHTVEIRENTADENGTVVATVNVTVEEESAYSALALGYLTPEDEPADTPFQVSMTEDATTTVHLPSEEMGPPEEPGNASEAPGEGPPEEPGNQSEAPGEA